MKRFFTADTYSSSLMQMMSSYPKQKDKKKEKKEIQTHPKLKKIENALNSFQSLTFITNT